MSSDPFVRFVADLHAEKHVVYGDSWKRRGEQVGILANVARKIDRLGVAGAGDTSADTAIDLLVYLCKYRLWMVNALWEAPPAGFTRDSANDGPAAVEKLLASLPTVEVGSVENLIRYEQQTFEELLLLVEENAQRARTVDNMIACCNPLARALWQRELVPVRREST